jgi:hypothetical protein
MMTTIIEWKLFFSLQNCCHSARYRLLFFPYHHLKDYKKSKKASLFWLLSKPTKKKQKKKAKKIFHHYKSRKESCQRKWDEIFFYCLKKIKMKNLQKTYCFLFTQLEIIVVWNFTFFYFLLVLRIISVTKLTRFEVLENSAGIKRLDFLLIIFILSLLCVVLGKWQTKKN